MSASRDLDMIAVAIESITGRKVRMAFLSPCRICGAKTDCEQLRSGKCQACRTPWPGIRGRQNHEIN